MKDIYNLKLHEEVRIGNVTIVRVPGGWLYVYYKSGYTMGDLVPVYVPYHNEFQEISKEVNE